MAGAAVPINSLDLYSAWLIKEKTDDDDKDISGNRSRIVLLISPIKEIYEFKATT